MTRAARCTTIGLAVTIGLVSASFAQDSDVLASGTPAGTGEATERQRPFGSLDGLTLEPRQHSGVFIDAPNGSVRVGPEYVGGQPVYARRTTPAAGIAVVEISVTPFADAALAVGGFTDQRPDQPASW